MPLNDCLIVPVLFGSIDFKLSIYLRFVKSLSSKDKENKLSITKSKDRNILQILFLDAILIIYLNYL